MYARTAVNLIGGRNARRRQAKHSNDLSHLRVLCRPAARIAPYILMYSS
jgi:hypothetical protein